MIGTHNLRIEKDARKLAATAIVAAGYGGDMDEDTYDSRFTVQG